MSWWFTPPTVDVPAVKGKDVLWSRIKMQQGVAVLRTLDGFFVQYRIVPESAMSAATDVWLGGHSYPVSSVMRDELVVAGYGAFTEDR